MPKFGSVQFFKDSAEPRTGLQVRSRKLAELQTRPSVQVQDGSVLGSGGLNPELNFLYQKFSKMALSFVLVQMTVDMAQNSCIQATG